MELNNEEKLTHHQKYRASKTQWSRGDAFCPYGQKKIITKMEFQGIYKHESIFSMNY